MPLGILSQSAGGGAAASYELISSSFLATTTSSVTFSSLSASYTHLQIRIAGRFTAATSQNAVTLRFNSDSATNYAHHWLRGNGTTASTSGSTTQAQIVAAYMPGANEATNIYGAAVIDILNFNNANKTKVVRGFSGRFGAAGWIEETSGFWNSTAAITSILVSDAVGSGSFAAGTRISLYGIRGA